MKHKIYILIAIIYLTAFSGAVMEYFPPLRSFQSYFLLTIDILISYLGISSILYVKKGVVIGLIALIAISVLNFLNSENSVIAHVNGLREITNIYFLFIFFYHLFNSGYQYWFNDLFKTFAVIFLIAQIPFSIIQFLKYGATDDVGGTLGAGYSGIMTLSIFALVYYLMENRSHNESVLTKLKYLISISYFFLPVFLNETKITFILIPLLFATLIKFNQIKSVFLGIVLAGTFLMVFSNLFSSYGTSYENPIKFIYNKDYLTEYLAGEGIGEDIDVPRFTKLIVGTKLLAEEKLKLFFGQEYGAFKGGTTLSLTPFAAKYNWLLYGSRPYLFYALITGGIALILLIITLVVGLIRDKPYQHFRNFSNSLLFFLTSIFLIILFYNDALRYEFFILMFFYVLFFSKYFNTPKVLVYEK